MNTKKAGRVAQVIKCLPSKHKALSSNPSTANKNNKYIKINKMSSCRI
jgi:hypothetical protein